EDLEIDPLGGGEPVEAPYQMPDLLLFVIVNTFVLKYLAGYLVCFIIAVLYFVLMPLVGLFFCCCRLCDNCGGHVKKRTKTTACERNTLATFLLLTTLIILEHKISAELNSLQFDITQTLSSTSCIGCDAKLINNLQLNGTYSPVRDIPKSWLCDCSDSRPNLAHFSASVCSSLFLLCFCPSLACSSLMCVVYLCRWIVSIVLCSIILLIIACNVLGLLLGTIGIALGDDPYSANGCSQSGANFLMAGVGFSFLFSWLLILLVFITFIVGGLAYTEICKPWANGDIYKVSASISTAATCIYTIGCKRGDSLWTILQLDRTFDLDEKLNVNKYTDDLVKNLRRLNVDLNSITLLNSGGRNVLQEFVASGIKNIDYQAFSEQVGNLPLLHMGAGASGNKPLPEQFIWGIARLIIIIILSDLKPRLFSFQATECFIAKELGYFEGYLKWVRKAVSAMNAFWFCLAWCTLFLIPSIIFAVKTAKHFRPIKGMFRYVISMLKLCCTKPPVPSAVRTPQR
uniref:Prominin 2 n=1 Tax=Callorhinchus milii TaxID=7868 RepID=A0A4W3I7B9_CALMI